MSGDGTGRSYLNHPGFTWVYSNLQGEQYMDAEDRPAGQVVVLDAKGGVAREAGAPTALPDRLREMINRGERSILLDVAQVSYLDSMLLGALVQAYVAAIRRGATLRLLHVTERFRKLLAVTKLDRILQTIETEERRPGGDT
jgi:anti-sigma B factor antagonist